MRYAIQTRARVQATQMHRYAPDLTFKGAACCNCSCIVYQIPEACRKGQILKTKGG